MDKCRKLILINKSVAITQAFCCFFAKSLHEALFHKKTSVFKQFFASFIVQFTIEQLPIEFKISTSFPLTH